jgi:hypothetical protein
MKIYAQIVARDKKLLLIHINKMRKYTKNGNRMSTKNSRSRKVLGEADYKFGTMRQRVARPVRGQMITNDTRDGGNVGGAGFVNTDGNPSQAFYNSINSGFNRFGCSFLNARWTVLSDRLNGLQQAGTNPRWQMLLNNKLNFIWNLGNKNGCWAVGTAGATVDATGGSNNPAQHSNNQAFKCKQSGASYGMKKINGRVRGEIKRPLQYRNPLKTY